MTTSILERIDRIFKSTDLPRTVDGNVKTEVLNLPSSYPDPVTVSVLNEILTEVSPLDTSNVTISHPLPAGTNNIGDVDIVTLPLPPDASKESTQLLVKNKTDALYSELSSIAVGSLKDRISRLETKLTSILSEIQNYQATHDLYSEPKTILGSANASSSIISTANYSSVSINLQSGTLSAGL